MGRIKSLQEWTKKRKFFTHWKINKDDIIIFDGDKKIGRVNMKSIMDYWLISLNFIRKFD